MSSVNQPFGLRVARGDGSYIKNTEVGIDTATTVIRPSAPVAYQADGTIATATNGPGNRIAGVFAGSDYVDASGKPNVDKSWPGSFGHTNAKGYIFDQPELVFEVQANGPVLRSAIGSQGNLINTTTANSAGFPDAVLDVATLSTTVENQFVIVGIEKSEDNDWGDAFTKVLVKISQHQFGADVAAF